MPPNLGGFFMVRSYYPSECHADYFDFERIEALKPAIEACGISTLSQSPMLGFHKQMDNRIKLLEEILSFRMQGVEFDNGDMYVDGHKAASDVRDEFVSVTEKLMDELAQCYNVLPQLDINNTIDHRPEGDEKWFLENEKTVTQFCRKLAAERPLKDIRDEYNYPKKKDIKDECSRLLEASTMKSRRSFAIQRLMNAMRQAHADGWVIVFDTLTLADDRLKAFYDNPNALRDYFRDIGRMVLAAEGRKANDSHADCYQYFCVPEYCTANGRLQFHAVHFMRTLPTGSVDPNFVCFFQAEDGIRDYKVTGVQTCALPISAGLEHARGLAQHLLLGIAQQPREGAVDREDAAARVGDDHALHGVVHHGGGQALAFVGLPPGGHRGMGSALSTAHAPQQPAAAHGRDQHQGHRGQHAPLRRRLGRNLQVRQQPFHAPEPQQTCAHVQGHCAPERYSGLLSLILHVVPQNVPRTCDLRRVVSMLRQLRRYDPSLYSYPFVPRPARSGTCRLGLSARARRQHRRGRAV